MKKKERKREKTGVVIISNKVAFRTKISQFFLKKNLLYNEKRLDYLKKHIILSVYN